MNFHPAGPHQSTPYLAIFDTTEMVDNKSLQVRATMLMWARTDAEALRYVSGHYRNVDPTKVHLHRVDPKHHLGTKRVVLNVTQPLPNLNKEPTDCGV